MFERSALLQLCEARFVIILFLDSGLSYANTTIGTDCVYDQEKSKPGMRPGAIESLNQRVGEYPITTFPQHGHSHLDPSRIGEHVCRTRSSLAADVEQHQPPKSP